MRRIGITLIVAACLLLGGCAVSGEVENQAYALVLGIDRDAAGIGLSIRIPRIGQAQSKGGESNDAAEPYLTLYASGDSYAEALEQLQWVAARELNLSQLKLIVASEAVAASDGFRDLIAEVAETRHLYTTAGFIVCDDSAREFVGGMKTVLGTRLSSEIAAMFRHSAAHGFIPRATFADLYYATYSGRSDPTGIIGFFAEGDAADAMAVLPESDASGGSSEGARRFLGTAVFRNGKLALRLDALETLCLDLLGGHVEDFTWAGGDRAVHLSTARRTRLGASVEGGLRLSADVALMSEEALTVDSAADIEASIASSLAATVRRCQAAGVDPFGFSECALSRFLTFDDWRAFNWRGRYPYADVDVKVHIVASGP